MSLRILSRAELPSATIALARYLLGRQIVRESDAGLVAGTIVETEAYPPGDPAAHAYRRMTPRNRSLFLRPGHAYVYRAYGTAWMLNVSSEPAGVGAGVLIRAVAPEDGVALMLARRQAGPAGARVAARDITCGPGRLAAAFAIDRALDGLDLCEPGPLYLAHGKAAAPAEAMIGESVRIGITRAVEQPWRFYLRGSHFLSGPGWLNGAGARRARAPCRSTSQTPM